MKFLFRPLLAAAVVALGAVVFLSRAQADDQRAPHYVVVVNAANKFQGADARELVKQLFLKNRTQWPGGLEALPFDRAAGSPEQAAFNRLVLGLSESEVAQHWISLKQRTGATRPRELASDSMALKMVEKYEGAFALVSHTAAAAADKSKVTLLLDLGSP